MNIECLKDIDPNRHYTAADLAFCREYNHIYSPWTIYYHVKKGRIKAKKLKGCNKLLIKGQDFIDFVKGEFFNV